jgi:hypothetical protein
MAGNRRGEGDSIASCSFGKHYSGDNFLGWRLPFFLSSIFLALFQLIVRCIVLLLLCIVCLGSFLSLHLSSFSVSIWLCHMKSWGGVSVDT